MALRCFYSGGAGAVGEVRAGRQRPDGFHRGGHGLHLVLAAGAMGFGYAAWNVGILHGNVTILAGASYFIPVLSSALSVWLLGASLSWAFWQGAAMVCAGAILCWLATRR